MEPNNPTLGLRNEISLIALFTVLVGSALLGLLFLESKGMLYAIGSLIGVFYIVSIVKFPKFGFYSFYTFTFWMFTLNLYTGLEQTGVLADAILLINVVCLSLVKFNEVESNRHAFSHKSVWIWSAWLIICLGINLLNFENVSWQSFLYGVRRFHLNPIGFVILNILVIKTKQDFYHFFKITGIFLAIAFLVGYRQYYFGFNSYENALLETSFGETHLIQGSIRYWGAFSDSANYGIAMSFFAIIFSGLALIARTTRAKLWNILIAAMSLHHVLISGTRTAFATFGIGFLIFILFYTRGRLRLISLLSSVFTYLLLKFTWLGNNIDLIRRVRTSFNPDDASLLLRINNRLLLENWLTTNPLGGGIGGTLFDRRFAPDTFLSTFPPDGLYTLIKAETGKIGLYSYNLIMVAIILYMVIVLLKLKPYGEKKLWMIIILAITLGARLAEYAQFTTYQFPTVNLLFFLLIAFEKWETWQDEQLPVQQDKPPFR